ncbi:glutathione peroxidase [Enterococcus lactis]|uniref:glutathione peroxidase n=1 Tax=Enterococcus lactis TaxID=357441 RepID=UPI002411609F|nr:glutathione peroxidase [Enterococcus lactis]
MSIYNFEVALEDGTVYLLEKYAGKPIIIVNTATKCGLAPQFEQLEKLYQTYQSQDLVILGFPSNQFKQELASATEAAEACKATYGVTFPMHQLIDVNGENTDPLFTYLKNEAPGTVTKAIKWNFTKFLIDRNGIVIERFAPQTSPLKMTTAIESVL